MSTRNSFTFESANSQTSSADTRSTQSYDTTISFQLEADRSTNDSTANRRQAAVARVKSAVLVLRDCIIGLDFPEGRYKSQITEFVASMQDLEPLVSVEQYDEALQTALNAAMIPEKVGREWMKKGSLQPETTQLDKDKHDAANFRPFGHRRP